MSENWQADSQNHNFAGQSQQGYHKKGRFRMGMVEDLTDDAKVQNGYDLWDSDSSVNYMVWGEAKCQK